MHSYIYLYTKDYSYIYTNREVHNYIRNSYCVKYPHIRLFEKDSGRLNLCLNSLSVLSHNERKIASMIKYIQD